MDIGNNFLGRINNCCPTHFQILGMNRATSRFRPVEVIHRARNPLRKLFFWFKTSKHGHTKSKKTGMD